MTFKIGDIVRTKPMQINEIDNNGNILVQGCEVLGKIICFHPDDFELIPAPLTQEELDNVVTVTLYQADRATAHAEDIPEWFIKSFELAGYEITRRQK